MLDELPLDVVNIIMEYKQQLEDAIRMAWLRFKLHREFFMHYHADFSRDWGTYLSDSDEMY